ncbi:Neutral ceramidase 3, partial [Camellia lanceoleosa]
SFDVIVNGIEGSIIQAHENLRPRSIMVNKERMKEKASRIPMCYNPIWLRIGLYIIFCGDSLLSDEDINSEKEIAFLKIDFWSFLLSSSKGKEFLHSNM